MTFLRRECLLLTQSGHLAQTKNQTRLKEKSNSSSSLLSVRWLSASRHNARHRQPSQNRRQLYRQEPHMTAISGGRATDERVKCLRIFADANGETHIEDIDIALQPRKLFKDNPPLRLSENFPATWYNVCYVPTDIGEVDWHNPPQRLLVLWLTGEVEFETSDGDSRRLPPGSVVWRRIRQARDTFLAILPRAS